MRQIVIILLALALAFNLYYLFPEVAEPAPVLNDGALHQLALEQTAAALTAGRDPTDFWLATVSLGYPLFHHYQHLAYLPPALLYILSGSRIPLAALYAWTVYLLLSFFPLSIYWSMRRFGFERLPAALAGLLASLPATAGLFGFDYGSYVWRGSGLYTQLWGMVLLPPALAQSYLTLRTGRGYVWATLLLAATLLAHLVYGYMAVLSLGVLAFLGALGQGKAVRSYLARLMLLLSLVSLATAYFWLPFWLDRAYMNRSVWEDAGKYNSYGHNWVLAALVKGELFDFGRFPALTLLAGLGLLVALRRWRQAHYRIPVGLALFWLLLYFGRPTWGPLLDFLPLSRDLHFHRLIAGVHLGGIYLAGLGLAWPWQWVLAQAGSKTVKVYLIPALFLLTGLLLYPVYAERSSYLAQNSQWRTAGQTALLAEQQDLSQLIQALRQAPPGRVYAGLGNNWGREYKIGPVPMYTVLNNAGLDTLGYLYHALSLNADVLVLFDETRPEHYDLFNVRYVVAPVDHPLPNFARPIQTFGRHRLYEVATSGYFDLVDAGVAFTGHKEELYPAAATWLNSSLLSVKQYPAILFDAVPGVNLSRLPLDQASQVIGQLTPPPPQAPGRILSETVEPGVYKVRVNVERSSTLLLKVTYHPNWHVLVDGQTAPPLMLMPSYIGIPVEPGQHDIQVAYQPGLLRFWLEALGLLLIPLIALAEQRRAVLAGWMSQLAAKAPKARFLKKASGVDFRVQLGLYLLFLSVYLISASGHFTSTDHVSLYLTTQSLVQEHTLAIKPINDAIVGADGQFFGAFGPGQAIVSIPFYVLGLLIDRLSSPGLKAYWGGPDLGDWGGTVPIFFVSLFNQMITPFLCLLLFHFCRRLGFSLRRSFAVTLIFGFGTAVWVYAQQYFQHPLESLCLFGAIYLLFVRRDHLKPEHALLSGSVLGLGILTRSNLLLVAGPLVIYLGYCVLSQKNTARFAPGLKAAILYLGAFTLPLLLVLVILVYVNHLKYGYYLSTRLSYTPGNWLDTLRFGFDTLLADSRWRLDREGWANPIWIGLYGNLASPGRSIFLYSPPLVIALFTFHKFYRQFRAEALLCLSLVLLYLIPYSLYGHWHGGWAWGPRLMLPIIPMLMLPLGYFLETPRQMVIVSLLALLGAGVQILGLTINFSYIHWEWLQMGFSLKQPYYLFIPDLSPLPMHLKALLASRHLDLWLLWIYQQYGLPVLLATMALPLLLLVRSLIWLKGLYLPDGAVATKLFPSKSLSNDESN